MMWYRSKQETTQSGSLHWLHKYRLSIRCLCLSQTMQRHVGLSFLWVGGIRIKKCLSVRRNAFLSKLGLPPLRSTDDFTSVPYFSTICLTNFMRKFNASNLPLFILCEHWMDSAGNYMFKVNYRNTRKKVWNMFKVNNKATKTTSVVSFW